MLPVNSLDDYLPWADNTEIFSRLDRIACLSVVNIQSGIITFDI